jgi:hypothetical protein
MGSKTFDSKCYELAEYFCDDAGVVDPATVRELAADIQQTIEDFLHVAEPDV